MPVIEKLTDSKTEELLGKTLFKDWQALTSLIKNQYDMGEEWHTADKGNAFELKFRRGGKTLVSMFPNFPEKNAIGVMVIFGKAEREKFESQSSFSNYVLETYQQAKTFHDGKWVMFIAPSKELENDLLAMLSLKRKPNKNSSAH